MMVETTERGTARRAFHTRGGDRLLEIAVAGKTGSLNGVDPDGHYEWFIGLAPAESPRIAIATLVVNRGRWHRHASQVAADVLREVFCGAAGCPSELVPAPREAERPRRRGASADTRRVASRR
jgi:cell division protein FtsI/penicillin-binding protein 2